MALKVMKAASMNDSHVICRIVEPGTTASFKMTINSCLLLLAARPVRVIGSACSFVVVGRYGHILMDIVIHFTR